MKVCRILPGALLTIALVVGGSGVVSADPGSRPAMDRGTVDCEELAQKLTELMGRRDRVVDRIFALQTRRDAAMAAGQTQRADRLQRAIDAHLAIQARLDARLERTQGAYDAACNQET